MSLYVVFLTLKPVIKESSGESCFTAHASWAWSILIWLTFQTRRETFITGVFVAIKRYGNKNILGV